MKAEPIWLSGIKGGTSGVTESVVAPGRGMQEQLAHVDFLPLPALGSQLIYPRLFQKVPQAR